MRIINRFSAVVFVSALLVMPYATFAKTTVIAGITPGLQYIEKDRDAGPVTDLLKMLFKEAKLDYAFETTNWAKAHQMFATTPQSLMFSVARFDSRENDFVWVLDVGPIDLRIARSKERPDLNPTTLEELKRHRIAVVRGSTPNSLLLEAGFVEGEDFGTVMAADEILQFMGKGFVEFVFFEPTISPLMLKLNNYPNDYLVPLDIPLSISKKLWLVATHDFPEEKLKLLRETHQRLLDDSTYQSLRKAGLCSNPIFS
jgi:ABC-type amino acid transport substrate-binding protein